MGNSFWKQQPQFTTFSKSQIFGVFGGFLVYRMYLNKISREKLEKNRSSWSGEPSKWHLFFNQKFDIFKLFHFSLRKTRQKNMKFCTNEAHLCIFKEKKKIKIWKFKISLNKVFCQTWPCFFRLDLINRRFPKMPIFYIFLTSIFGKIRKFYIKKTIFVSGQLFLSGSTEAIYKK